MFQTRAVSNQSVEPVVRSREQYDLVVEIENILWGDFIEVRMLGITNNIRATLQRYDTRTHSTVDTGDTRTRQTRLGSRQYRRRSTRSAN